MKKILLLLFYLGIFLQNSIACSCETESDFFVNIKNTSAQCIAVLDSVTNSYEYLGQPGDTGHFTLIDTISGIKTPIGSNIVVLGQDGVNCLQSMYFFEVGDTFLLGISEGGFWEPLGLDTFSLFGCGPHYLNIEDRQQLGLSIPQLKDKVSQLLTSTSTIVTDHLLSLYPNPVQNTLYLSLENEFINNLIIYSINGQQWAHLVGIKQHQVEIITSEYPAGLYQIHIETDRGIIIQKFLKL